MRHELLTVETQAQTSTRNAIVAESNASPTVHQGVELSLLSPLWDGGRNGALALRQAYTFSDFHYRDDERFGDNTLPGIPKHYYQAQLRYSHPTGFTPASTPSIPHGWRWTTPIPATPPPIPCWVPPLAMTRLGRIGRPGSTCANFFHQPALRHCHARLHDKGLTWPDPHRATGVASIPGCHGAGAKSANMGRPMPRLEM